MKKINLLAIIVAGVFTVACNGGGSGSSGGGNTVDACANGAATCGAPSSAESVEKVIPLNALPVVGLKALTTANEPIIKSATNLYLSNQESTFITFSVESNGITQPFIMDFSIRAKFNTNVLPEFVATTSAGQNANQCKFPADVNGSYVCTLTISPNNAPAGAYEIIGTIENGNQPFEINVVTNYQAPTSVVLPFGTYLNNSTVVDRDTFGPDGIWGCYTPKLVNVQTYDPGETFVVTPNGSYNCRPTSLYDGAACYGPSTGTLTATPLPSFVEYHEGKPSYNFNGMWQNNTLSFDYLDSSDTCLGSGLIPTIRLTYINSSQNIPYPIH